MSSAARILIVDDDDCFRRACRRALEQAGYPASEASSFAEGERALIGTAWDVVLLDLHLGDGNGLDLIPLITRLVPAPGVAVISGTADAEVVFDLQIRGLLVLPKPVGCELLLSIVASRTPRRQPTVLAFAEAMLLSPRESEVIERAHAHHPRHRERAWLR